MLPLLGTEDNHFINVVFPTRQTMGGKDYLGGIIEFLPRSLQRSAFGIPFVRSKPSHEKQDDEHDQDDADDTNTAVAIAIAVAAEAATKPTEQEDHEDDDEDESERHGAFLSRTYDG